MTKLKAYVPLIGGITLIVFGIIYLTRGENVKAGAGILVGLTLIGPFVFARLK